MWSADTNVPQFRKRSSSASKMLVESQLCTILVAQRSIDSVCRWRLWMVMPQETSRIQAAWHSITLDSSANPYLLLQEEGLDMSNSRLIFFSRNNELETTATLRGQKHSETLICWNDQGSAVQLPSTFANLWHIRFPDWGHQDLLDSWSNSRGTDWEHFSFTTIPYLTSHYIALCCDVLFHTFWHGRLRFEWTLTLITSADPISFGWRYSKNSQTEEICICVCGCRTWF